MPRAQLWIFFRASQRVSADWCCPTSDPGEAVGPSEQQQNALPPPHQHKRGCRGAGREQQPRPRHCGHRLNGHDAGAIAAESLQQATRVDRDLAFTNGTRPLSDHRDLAFAAASACQASAPLGVVAGLGVGAASQGGRTLPTNARGHQAHQVCRFVGASSIGTSQASAVLMFPSATAAQALNGEGISGLGALAAELRAGFASGEESTH